MAAGSNSAHPPMPKTTQLASNGACHVSPNPPPPVPAMAVIAAPASDAIAHGRNIARIVR